MTRIVAISAGLSEPSSTRLLADRLTESASRAVGGAEANVVELRPLAHQITDAMLTGFAGGDLAAAYDAVKSADAVIAVTPVFSASYSGLFKSFFDVMEPGLLEDKPVLLAATAGTARHSLVLEHALRPLFSYLKAVVVPTAVFAATEDFGSSRDGALQERIDRAAGQLAALVQGAGAAKAPAADPFDDSAEGYADFASLLEE